MRALLQFSTEMSFKNIFFFPLQLLKNTDEKQKIYYFINLLIHFLLCFILLIDLLFSYFVLFFFNQHLYECPYLKRNLHHV